MLLFVVFLPTLAALAVFAAALPYRSMRAARSNTLRRDGTRSSERSRSEVRAFWRFTRRAHLLPLAGLLVVQTALLVAVELAGSGSVLADLFGEHHPDVALHARDLEEWGAWAAEVHAARSANPTFASVMTWQWPLWPTYLVMSAVALAAYARTHLVRQTARYARGVRRRRRALRADQPVQLSDLKS